MDIKELSNVLELRLTKTIEESGYNNYKPKQFIKVNNEVLMVIRLFFSKADIYIWHALYPLCENDLSLGSGTIAGRFPIEENTLNIQEFENFDISAKCLDEGLHDIIQFQKNRSTVSQIERSIPSNAKPLPLFVKGFCLAAQGKYQESKRFIDSFMMFGLNFGESKKGAERLLASFLDGSTESLLENNKASNIKKLRLKKYLK
ncbi:MAG: hypothetical protein GY931_08565 [Maribacter sp.]|nr:hypothetical protein [Maribacter sp.]